MKKPCKSWRCFFCDEVFTDVESAKEHFGTDQYEGCESPGCVDPLRADEKARLKELRAAEDYARQCQREAEEAEADAASFKSYQAEIGRLFGEVGGVIASTPHQAWLKLEAAQNEAEMWKQRALLKESA